MADERPTVDVITSPGFPEGARVWWKQPLDASPGSIVWVGTDIETCTALGQRVLTAAGVESTAPSELKETFLEVLRQSLSRFATAVGAQLGREIVCADGLE